MKFDGAEKEVEVRKTAKGASNQAGSVADRW
jgi:hypothetical protein